MNRTCLDLLKDDKNFDNLNHMQKITMSFLNPVQNIDNDNTIYNIDNVSEFGARNQCAFTSNSKSLFSIVDNTMHVPKDLFWDRPEIINDKLYNFTGNQDYPTNASIINPNTIQDVSYDGYYSLFKDDISQIKTLCNLVNSYNTSNPILMDSNNKIISKIIQVANWNDQLNANIERLRQQKMNLINTLNNMQNSFNNLKQQYQTIIYASDANRPPNYIIPYTDYQYIGWTDGDTSIVGMPNFSTIMPATNWHPPVVSSLSTSIPVSIKQACSRPDGWCTHDGSSYRQVDCIGDGVVGDHLCTDNTGQRGTVLRNNGCSSIWPDAPVGSCSLVGF
jgi:hypothetical protein